MNSLPGIAFSGSRGSHIGTIGWRLGVFLSIFAPVLNVGLGAYGDSLSLLCVVLIGWAVISPPLGRLPLPRELQSLCLLLVGTAAYGIVASVLFSSEVGAIQVAIRPVRALIMFLGISIFIVMYARRFGAEFQDRLIYDVFLAIGLHAVIMIVQFLYPPFRDWLYPYTFADQANEYNQRFRMAGLTNGGGAQLSLFQAAGILLWPLVLSHQKGIVARTSTALIVVCILASLILSGRSGIVLALALLPVVTFLAYRGRGVIKLAVRQSIEVVSVGLILVIGVAFSSQLENFEDIAYAETAWNRSLDFLFSTEGLFEREDVSGLFGEQYFFPDDTKTLLVGDAYLFDAAYRMEERLVASDSGYVVFLFGYGLVGSVIQYAFYFLIIWYAMRYAKYGRALAVFSVAWGVSILVFQTKEILVFSRMGFSLTTIFIAALTIARMRAGRVARPNEETC